MPDRPEGGKQGDEPEGCPGGNSRPAPAGDQRKGDQEQRDRAHRGRGLRGGLGDVVRQDAVEQAPEWQDALSLHGEAQAAAAVRLADKLHRGRELKRKDPGSERGTSRQGGGGGDESFRRAPSDKDGG